MAGGSFSLVWCGNLTLTEVAPFVNHFCDLLKLYFKPKLPNTHAFVQMTRPIFQIELKVFRQMAYGWENYASVSNTKT